MTDCNGQIRKLFEPELYPLAKIRGFYDQYFGTDRADNSELCAVGFEPNIHLKAGLKVRDQSA